MLHEKMEKALNDQINAELYSGYMYLSMSAYFSSKNLEGSAQWMKAQALEEQFHAMKMYDYVIERGGAVRLTAIEAPPTEWDGPLTVFEAVLTHEQKVTGLINDLVNLAQELRDHATNNFLQWFVAEQVEEEASADGVLQKMKLVEKSGGGLFMIDRELSARVPAWPAPKE
jgi:ferritin